MDDKQILIALIKLIERQCDRIYRNEKGSCDNCPMCDGDKCNIRIMNWNWEAINGQQNRMRIRDHE